MHTAIIIEDEENAAELLNRYCQMYCNLRIVAMAKDVDTGANLILQHNPEIVFLDISLPGKYGFELFKIIEKPEFEVIFVTAFDQYALQAIKVSAVDYLLKPVEIDELTKAVEKALDRVAKNKKNPTLDVLLSNLRSGGESRKMAIPDGGSYIFCDTKEIIRLRAQGRYCEIFLQSGKKITVSKNLGEYEQMLADQPFLRVHHSHIVNCNHILKFDRSDGGSLIMSDQSVIEVSRRKKDELLAVIKGLNQL